MLLSPRPMIMLFRTRRAPCTRLFVAAVLGLTAIGVVPASVHAQARPPKAAPPKGSVAKPGGSKPGTALAPAGKDTVIRGVRLAATPPAPAPYLERFSVAGGIARPMFDLAPTYARGVAVLGRWRMSADDARTEYGLTIGYRTLRPTAAADSLGLRPIVTMSAGLGMRVVLATSVLEGTTFKGYGIGDMGLHRYVLRTECATGAPGCTRPAATAETHLGASAGIGVEGVFGRHHLFAEGRLEGMLAGATALPAVPIVVGLRW